MDLNGLLIVLVGLVDIPEEDDLERYSNANVVYGRDNRIHSQNESPIATLRVGKKPILGQQLKYHIPNHTLCP